MLHNLFFLIRGTTRVVNIPLVITFSTLTAPREAVLDITDC